jgi:hypothetical protein
LKRKKQALGLEDMTGGDKKRREKYIEANFGRREIKKKEDYSCEKDKTINFQGVKKQKVLNLPELEGGHQKQQEKESVQTLNFGITSWEVLA